MKDAQGELPSIWEAPGSLELIVPKSCERGNLNLSYLDETII